MLFCIFRGLKKRMIGADNRFCDGFLCGCLIAVCLIVAVKNALAI